MAKYTFQLTNGKTLTLEGDSQPSDADVEAAAAEQGVALVAADAEAPLDQAAKNERLKAANLKPLSEPETYGGGFLRSVGDTVKETAGSFLEGALDVVNPNTYIEGYAAKKADEARMLNEAKGNLTPGEGLPADYGVSSLKEMGRTLSTPKGGGRMIGNLVTGLVTPRVTPKAMALGRDTAAGVRNITNNPVARNIAAQVVKHGATATGAATAGVPGAIAGATMGEELASRIRLPKAKPAAAPPTIAQLSDEMGLSAPHPLDNYLMGGDAAVPAATPAAPAVAAAAETPAAIVRRMNADAMAGRRSNRGIGGLTEEAPGGLSDLRAGKVPRYPMPEGPPTNPAFLKFAEEPGNALEAQLAQMERNQPAFTFEGSSTGMPNDLPPPGLTVAAPTGVPRGAPPVAAGAIEQELIARELPNTSQLPMAGKVPVKGNVPPSKSRRSPMSATPGLTVEDARMLGINPDVRITGLTADAIDRLLADRAARSAAYRTNAGMDAGFNRSVQE